MTINKPISKILICDESEGMIRCPACRSGSIVTTPEKSGSVDGMRIPRTHHCNRCGRVWTEDER